MPRDKIDKELQDALKDIVDSCEKEDAELRKSMVRAWTKNEQFWHGIQYLFWSERDDSWRSPLDFNWDGDDADDADLGPFSDKVVDIFKGHGESIISALAAQIPALRYLPDDADDDEDVITARTRSKLADLIQRHNKARLVFLRALFFLALHGIVASYRYKDSDFAYGSYKVPKMGVNNQEVPVLTCQECGYSGEDPTEFQAGCPTCKAPPENIKEEMKEQSVPVILGQEELPKSRIKLDIFGPLHFKVSYHARNQKECTYLLLYGDLGKDVVKSEYEELEDEIDGESLESTDRFVAAARDGELSSKHLITVRKCWLRPEAYFRCDKKQIREKIQKQFPKGCRVTLLGKTRIFADAIPEEFDSRWEIGQAGLSTFIHSDPILRPLVMIQEMRNDLVNLIVETVKHGIPTEFADPQILNFDQFGKFEAKPGQVYQTKPGRPGEALSNGFYSGNRATLSREVAVFLSQLDKDAQFCIGSFPSIYGGPSEGKSRTFSEYAASRQMALQRLSIVWNLLTDWWTRTISGAVDLYIENMVTDEYFTMFQDNNYIKVWIKQSQLKGKVGGVEPEASESFPVSLAQKKDLILKLMELNNDFINSALYLPDNARVIQDVMALNEFKLPGEAQRVKQCTEIAELVKAAPIDEITSTVSPDMDVDDAKVHIATITAWAVDNIGLDCKRENPEGYANVMAHRRQHLQMLIQQTLQVGETPAGAPPKSAAQEEVSE